VAAINANPFNYAFVHYTDLDSAGHTYGWGSTTFNNSLTAVDGYLGSLFNLATTHPTLGCTSANKKEQGPLPVFRKGPLLVGTSVA